MGKLINVLGKNKQDDSIEFQSIKEDFGDKEKEKFETITKNTKETLLNILCFLNENMELDLESKKSIISENFNNLKENQQKTLIKKAKKTAIFLNKKKHEYKFNEWLKLILINLLHAREISKKLRYSRNGSDYERKGRYAKLHLKYDPFLFIIDALYLSGIINNKIGNYIKVLGYGYSSRITLTEEGIQLLSEIKSEIRFKIKDKELIIMKDNEKNIIKTERTDNLLKKEKFVKKVNNALDKIKINININEFIETKDNTINSLYIHYINNNINLYKLEGTVKGYIEQSDNYILNKEYIRKVNAITSKKGIIKIEDIRELVEDKYMLPLLMDIREKECYNNDICGYSNSSKSSCTLHLKKLKFEIINKHLFRVYSRNSFDKHGRWYNRVWMNLPKAIRKHIYINDNKNPLISLDFSAMHPRLAYHLKNMPYPSDPYIIDGYNMLDDRKIFKIVTLVSLNASNHNEAVHAAMEKLNNIGFEFTYFEVKKFVNDFIEYHSQISEYFCSDFGVTAMNFDSRVIEDCLRELLIKKGIAVLPIHDELLVPPEHEGLIINQMISSYRKVLKQFLVKRKILTKSEPLNKELLPIIG